MVLNKNDFDLTYWQYYLALENDFNKLNIPIDDMNASTFSFDYLKLFSIVCFEIDVTFKAFIQYITGEKMKKEDIIEYKKIILNKYPEFENKSIKCKDISPLIPYKNWSNGTLEWWTDYNKIKHERTEKRSDLENFKKATQKNVLLALSGLYQLEMYFYKELIDKEDPEKDIYLRIPVPQSKIFRIIDWNENIPLVDNRFTMHLKDGHLIWEGAID